MRPSLWSATTAAVASTVSWSSGSPTAYPAAMPEVETSVWSTSIGDVDVSVDADGVAVVEFRRPPANYFDVELIAAIADAYKALGADDRCRAILLCSEGRHFCAGADFSGDGPSS